MTVHFNCQAREGATLLRSNPNKNDASVSYVDIAVIGRTLKCTADSALMSGFKPGDRVDVAGDESETEFNGKKEVRYEIKQISPATGKASA